MSNEHLFCDNNFSEFFVLLLRKLTQFMSLDAMIKRKMFVKFLQNLEKVMKGFSKVIN